MKRMMVVPFQFGAAYSEYGWEFAGSGLPAFPHFDHCVGYRKEISFRIWEPGREALSEPGFIDAGGLDGRAPEIPATTTIHGIKGAMHISFGADDDDLGNWEDDNGAPYEVTPQDAWMALTGGNSTSYSPAGVSERIPMMRRSASIRIPLFAALYRGTYKAIDNEGGWEIDSGPGDDPATLLGMDITNPSIIESSRFDWWDMDMVPLPRQRVSYNYVTTDPPRYEVTFGNDSTGGWHKYSMDLKTNKVLAPPQVLWLHFMTGRVKLPVYGKPAGASGIAPLTCLNYVNHRFACGMHASMMVSRRYKI